MTRIVLDEVGTEVFRFFLAVALINLASAPPPMLKLFLATIVLFYVPNFITKLTALALLGIGCGAGIRIPCRRVRLGAAATLEIFFVVLACH